MQKKREKDEFEKNKYKYSGIEGGRIGREKDGFLEIGQRDLDRIYGEKKKSEKSGGKNKFGKKKFKKGKNKNKKGRKIRK